MKTESPSSYREVKAIMDPASHKATQDEPVADLSCVAPQGAKQETPDGVTQARQHLCKAANLYILCVRCVDKMIAPHVPPIAQTGEQFQSAVATLFIEASRMRFVDRMPSKPLK